MVMKKALATGTFDGLHEGHLDFLKQAKAEGFLVVIVATDKSVVEIKGSLPENKQDIRLENVAMTGIPDKVVLGDPDDKLKRVVEESPDTICLGYDQKIDENKLMSMLKARGLDVEIKRMKPYLPDKYKTSILRGKESEQKDIL